MGYGPVKVGDEVAYGEKDLCILLMDQRNLRHGCHLANVGLCQSLVKVSPLAQSEPSSGECRFNSSQGDASADPAAPMN
jgi:hypothetical protein